MSDNLHLSTENYSAAVFMKTELLELKKNNWFGFSFKCQPEYLWGFGLIISQNKKLGHL